MRNGVKGGRERELRQEAAAETLRGRRRRVGITVKKRRRKENFADGASETFFLINT